MRLGFTCLLFAQLGLGCSAVLGIDGAYDDQPDSDAASGGKGGSGGSGATPSGGAGGLGGSTTGGAAGINAGGTNAGGGGTGPGGGGTNAGGTGGVAGGENCTNGVDDDADSLIDCADPECQSAGFACVAAPNGFKGPFVFGQAPSLGSCPSAYPVESVTGGDVLVAPAANCGQISCSCASASGVPCSGLLVDYFGDASCTGQPKWTKLPSGGCYSSNFVHCATGCAYPTGATVDYGYPVSSGACQASSQGSPVVAPAKWNSPARLCSSGKTSGGCSAGECIAKAPAPFERICVYALGNVSCPVPFNAKLNLRNGFSDSRACSPCGCGAPALDCSAQVTDYYGSVCGAGGSGGGKGTPLDASCTAVEVSGAVSSETRYLEVTNHAASGPCTPSGSTPTGSATAGPTLTVCCMP